MSAHIITANNVETGAVVYLNQLFDWTTELAAARILTSDSEVEDVLQIIERAKISRNVVGVYAFEIEGMEDNKSPVPLRFREQIRVSGPTVTHAS